MKGKFGCPMLGNCNFKHSCLQNTRYITYQEWFIFPDLFRNSFWNGRGNKLLTNLSFPTVEAVGTNQNKTSLRLHVGFLDKRKKAPTLCLQDQKTFILMLPYWYLSEALLAEMILWKIMFINILEQIALSWHKPTINILLNKFYLQVLDLWLLLQRLSVH